MIKFNSNNKNKLTINENKLTYSKLIHFFVPLGVSTLLIAISNMILNRSLGFIPDSELYISSFSIARTFTMIFMSPVSAVTLVVTTFTENESTYKKVRKFTLYCAIILAILFSILSYTPISRVIFKNFYNLNGELLDNAVISLRTITFLPLLFLLRNFFLATAIKLRSTKFATLGSFSRALLVLIISFLIPEFLTFINPQNLPGIILFLMIFIESSIYAIAVIKSTKGKIVINIIQSLKEQNTYNPLSKISYKKILFFAVPLTLSFSIAQLLPSFTQSALATGENQALILTIYSVSMSVIHIISSFSFQLPQLIVNHDTSSHENKSIIRKFSFMLAIIAVFLLSVITFTKFGDVIFVNIMNLPVKNVDIAKTTLKFALLYPASAIYMSYKRGKLINIRKTGTLIFERAIASLIPLLLFLIVPLIAWQYGAGVGVLILSIANFASGTFSNIIYRISIKRNPSLITYTS